MKTISRMLVTMLFVAIPVLMTAQDKNKETETVKFVTSIDCENCVNKIMSNLPHEKGVKDVKCELTTKEVTVTYQKAKNNPEDLKKAIEKLGYTAKQLPAVNTDNKK